MLNIVLIHPEIPHNTGASGRLALATGARLHLVKPLGFDISDKAVKRAGLDYWQDVELHVWENVESFEAHLPPDARLILLTTKANHSLWETTFQDNDYLVFGRETQGLDAALREKYPEHAIRIPMIEGATRSLNLATAVSIVLYEACRQIGLPKI